MKFYKGLLLGVVTALVVITSSLWAPALTALQVDAIAQQPIGVNSQSQQTDESPLLTDEQVNAIARQTTVIIAQGLEKGDIEAQREFNPGSGVIVAKHGKTYYVATNLHVVRGRGGLYGVRTFDGEVHPVDDEKTSSNIHLFGDEQGENGETISGFDLAIVQFESDKDYPLATVNLSGISQSDKVFVSGWPNPEDQSSRRERRFSPGEMIELTPPSSDGGYGLSYNCTTRRGMSGGPVFNAKGEVVGIHGRAGEAQSISNLGIQVNDLMTQTQLAQSNELIPPDLIFDFPPVKSSVVNAKVDKQKSDVIDNIFNLFKEDILREVRNRVLPRCPRLPFGIRLPSEASQYCKSVK